MRREPDPFDGPGAAAYFQMRLSEDVFWGGQLDSDAALTRAPQALAPGARPTAVSWTGGKDCNLALLIAWRDPTLRVTSLVVFRPQDAAFRAHPLDLRWRVEESMCLRHRARLGLCVEMRVPC